MQTILLSSGTLLDTPDEPIVVDRIAAGQKIYCYDTESKRIVIGRVENISVDKVEKFFQIDTVHDCIKIGYDSLVMTKNGMVKVTELTTLDEVLIHTIRTDYKLVIALKISTGSFRMFRLQISNANCLANGFIISA